MHTFIYPKHHLSFNPITRSKICATNYRESDEGTSSRHCRRQRQTRSSFLQFFVDMQSFVHGAFLGVKFRWTFAKSTRRSSPPLVQYLQFEASRIYNAFLKVFIELLLFHLDRAIPSDSNIKYRRGSNHLSNEV